MGTVQYFLAVLMSAQLVLNSPTGVTRTYMMNNKSCQLCPAGMYWKSCNECEDCPEGGYTEDWNLETSCFQCFRDCEPTYHLRKTQNCTRTTPLKCECEPGFRCRTKNHQGNCIECEKTTETTASAVTASKDRQTSSAQIKSCNSPNCRHHAAPHPTDSKPAGHAGVQLPAILALVVFIGCVAILILFCIYQPRDETCFRQIIAKLCNEERQNATCKAKESTHQFPRDSCSAKQQTSPLSTANMGPVQVHNPGTVIFSLLSHFSGQVGPTVPSEKRADEESNEEDERDCPVFHPTPSPSVHISKEERGSEAEDVFFPSQEQGKDHHVSKEEDL